MKTNLEPIKANISPAYGWKYINVTDSYFGSSQVNEDLLRQIRSDINIGFEKGQREELLKHIELLTRRDVSIEMLIPLLETPTKSPHHLDNENEFDELEKSSFTALRISRIEKGRAAQIEGTTLHFKFDLYTLYELFTRLYTCMEIYATVEDNIMLINNEEGNTIRLVIWGVINGKPIYY
jgi:hypothetical protein